MTRLAIVIPADISAPIRTEQVDGVNDLQRLVGGWIEAAPLDREDIAAYLNEEGKLIPLPKNSRANEWWMANVSDTIPGDYVAGDLVITGFNAETGDDSSVPADLLAHFGL